MNPTAEKTRRTKELKAEKKIRQRWLLNGWSKVQSEEMLILFYFYFFSLFAIVPFRNCLYIFKKKSTSAWLQRMLFNVNDTGIKFGILL